MGTAHRNDERAKTKGVNTRWFQNGLADVRVSQRKLAKMMGVDPSAVTLMLKGRRAMSASEAALIAKVLGVSVDDVLREAGIEGFGGRRVAKERSTAASYREGGDGGRVSVFADEEGSGGGGNGDRPAKVVADTMFVMPVPMVDGTTAELTIPRVLTTEDAERISAVLNALVKKRP